MINRGPGFLDDPEDVQAAAANPPHAPVSGQELPLVAGLPHGPVLLEALPDAPARLDVGWTPEVVAAPRVRVGAVSWLVAGLCLLVGSWLALSIVSFVAGLFGQGVLLGAAGAVLVGSAVCMVLYAGLLEARAYRSLGNAERLRAVLAAPDTTVAILRARTLEWLGQTGEAIPDAPTVIRLVLEAGSVAEVRGILRSRVANPLRERAESLGRRAAVEGATLVAVCPHPAWDGLIAGARALLLVRRVAALYGLRPGLAVTLALLRQVAWTATGTTGLVLVSQGLADHVLTGLPIVKHVAGAIPGTGAVAVRLYRLAGVTAEACCPVPR